MDILEKKRFKYSRPHFTFCGLQPVHNKNFRGLQFSDPCIKPYPEPEEAFVGTKIVHKENI